MTPRSAFPRRSRLLRPALWLAILALLLAAAGCGYRNPYLEAQKAAEGDGGAPINLYVPMWNNKTNELGLESDFYNALYNWLQNTKMISLKSNPADADYLLSGSVDALNQGATRGTVRLTVSYSLKDLTSGGMTWPTTRQTISETYYVDDNDTMATQTAMRQALREIADDLAEKIYLRLFNDLSRLREQAPATPTETP